MRRIVTVAAPLLILALLLVGAGTTFEQPRCCLTWANAAMFKQWGYFPDKTIRQVEDLIYAACFALPCQWQVEPGFCPSQWGVEQVAASWQMPGYVNPPRWDWASARADTAAGRSIIFFWSGDGYSGPDGLMHAYYCSRYEPPRDARNIGRLWCVDALNQAGRWWDEGLIWAYWSGWSAGWRP